MTFLQPWWWLLALLVIPLLFWHARNPRSRVVPTSRLWRAIAPRVRRTSLDARRFRWRPDRSLWLQSLALSLLILALVGPRPTEQVVDHHVWLLDGSASMRAEDMSGTSSWASAVARARRGLAAADDAVRGGAFTSFVVMGANADVLAARNERPGSAAVALEAASADFARRPVYASRVRDALQGLIVDGETTRITVLTDPSGTEDAANVLEPWSDDPDVQVRSGTFGTSAPTHGFSAVRAVPLNETADADWRVEGDVVAYPTPAEPLTVRATFARDDVPGELPWEELNVEFTQPRSSFAFDTSFPASGVLTLSLAADNLPEDDVARLVFRSDPAPLRVLLMGKVPEPLVRALGTLDGVQITQEETDLAPSEAEPAHLAVVGPGATVGDRPAATVLWLAGMGPGKPRGEPIDAPTEWWAASGSPFWTGVDDVPEGAITEVYALPAVERARVLLRSRRGPLLRVRPTSSGTTDVEAAWSIGTTRWTRELGFARFLSELAWSARPNHGARTEMRCLVGARCLTDRSGLLASAPGVHEANGMRWSVDVEAGPETNLTRSGSDVGVPLPQPTRWRTLDQVLAGLAAALLAFDAARSWRRRRLARREAGVVRHWASVGLRLTAVAAAVLFAANVPTPTARFVEKAVLVLDPVTWTRETGPSAQRDAVQEASERAQAVVWAEKLGRAAPWASGTRPLVASAPEPAGYELDSVVNLAAALQESGGRVIVAGAQGEDGSPGTSRRLERSWQSTTVDVAQMHGRPVGEAWVAAVDVPSRLRAGDTAVVRVAVRGEDAAQRDVRVTVDGEPLEATRQGGRTLEWVPSEPGMHEVRAMLSSDSDAGLARNDERVELVTVEPPGRVALVGTDRPALEEFAERVEDAGFVVEMWRPSDMPVEVEEFLEFELVALLDVPAGEVHSRRQEALERWVREYGGGLVIAGAERAYGPGGYLRTPFEELSPLSARVPGEQPQAAIAFVLDRSGSMQQTAGGVSRLALTKEATVEAVDLLHPASQVALVVFDDEAHLLKPLGPTEGVAEVLNPVSAGGGTNLFPALESALDQLREARAEAKHMIVMTDGLSQAAPFGPLIDRIVEAEITISTVAVGRGADVNLLEDMAGRGGGVFHRSEDVRALPSILSQEAMLLSSNPVREDKIAPDFEPGEAAFAGELPSEFPELPGYVRTTAKPEAEVHARTSDGDPVLASWRHGVGRVVALATPLAGSWADGWSDTTFYQEFVGRGFRWSAAPLLRPGVALETYRDGDVIEVAARLIDERGQPIDSGSLVAHAERPDGSMRGPVALDSMGRGTYVGTLDAFEEGRYNVRVERIDETGAPSAAERNVHVSYPSSLGFGTQRVARASDLAKATGGRLVLVGDAPLVRDTMALDASGRVGLWAWLAVISAAIALTLDGIRVHMRKRAPPSERGRQPSKGASPRMHE